jgi:hypothetical protein
MEREKLIERHREINVDYEWWLDEFTNFRDEMRLDYGLYVGNINFSGFWSQGDGAQFELKGHNSVWELICKLGRQSEYAPWWESGDHTYRITTESLRYCHSSNMSVDITAYCDCGNHEDDVVLEAFNQHYCRMRDKQIADLEREIIAFFRDKADELYNRLECDYNYLTSDEGVWSTIEANDLHLEEEV